MPDGGNAKLIATQPDHADREYPLGDRSVVIGRDPTCDIVVDSQGVLPRHAEIEPFHGGYLLDAMVGGEELRVNGRPVSGSRALVPGDQIQIGDATITLVLAPDDAPEPPTDHAAETADTPQPSNETAIAPDGSGSLDQDERPEATPGETAVAPPEALDEEAPVQVSAAESVPPYPDARNPPAVAGTQGAEVAAEPATAEAPLASFQSRAGALLLDAVLAFFAWDLVVGERRYHGFKEGDVPAAVAVGYLIFLVYLAVGYSLGQTIGSRALGLRIVDVTSRQPPGFMKGIVRALLQGLYAVPIFLMFAWSGTDLFLLAQAALLIGPIGYAWARFDSNTQTLHDKAAGTVVLQTSRGWRRR